MIDGPQDGRRIDFGADEFGNNLQYLEGDICDEFLQDLNPLCELKLEAADGTRPRHCRVFLKPTENDLFLVVAVTADGNSAVVWFQRSVADIIKEMVWQYHRKIEDMFDQTDQNGKEQ
jgi:hypothetical protein